MSINISEVPRGAVYCMGQGYRCPCLDKDMTQADEYWVCHMCDHVWEEINPYLGYSSDGRPMRHHVCQCSERSAMEVYTEKLASILDSPAFRMLISTPEDPNV